MIQNYQTNSQQKCVWVIEDNELYRKNLLSLITESSNLICSKYFDKCEDAISELVNAWEPEIILCDIGLPGMSGIEGIQKIKKISPGTQIIVLTVYDDDDVLFNALCAGASGYLLKSSPINRIIEVINDVVNGGIVMDPPIAQKAMNMLKKDKDQSSFTYREKQLLELMQKGFTKKKLADQLHLSYHTINTQLRSIYNKLHVHSKSKVVVKSNPGKNW